MSTREYIRELQEGQTLDEVKSEALFDAVFTGSVSEIELAAILTAMKMRKETFQEILGAARSMRKYSIKFAISGTTHFDTCGTGGDNSHSFNVSSAVALVLNAMGTSITKHGNRSMSSKSGSADFLEALEVPISLTGDEASVYYESNRFIFLFAPAYHPAMKHAVPVRKALGVRTIFNFLGPLTNPLFPRKQMIGIFHPDFLPLYSEVVSRLDYERVFLYSGQSGMDEVSPFEPTIIYDVTSGNIKEFTLEPGEYLSQEEAAALPKGLTAQENAAVFMETIESRKPTPLGKLLALNTALALCLVDDTKDIKSNFKTSLDCIHSGEMGSTLSKLKGSPA